MSRILVIKTGETLPPIRARHGDFEAWIARGLGRALDELHVAAVYEGEPLPPMESLGGVVITGSPAMVSERADWSERTARWLVEVVERDALPVLGLCYGHQLLAHGLGGEVGPNPRGREMGTLEVRFADFLGGDEGDGGGEMGWGPVPLFTPGAFLAHFTHVESVLVPPSAARVLASTRLDPHSAIAFGPRQWGVQFHPEFDLEVMRGYLEARREVLLEESFDPDAMLRATRETPEMSALLGRFAAFVDGLA
ncbi:MAG: glutamine amidotransferase [Deltaproteobacteria bacterium]|nr:glutamine amidotransferase [Deltaproteobacteria bacterium]MBW2500988.1 glutamine amidotransferase [Deltaproteobacteria bacterium]